MLLTSRFLEPDGLIVKRPPGMDEVKPPALINGVFPACCCAASNGPNKSFGSGANRELTRLPANAPPAVPRMLSKILIVLLSPSPLSPKLRSELPTFFRILEGDVSVSKLKNPPNKLEPLPALVPIIPPGYAPVLIKPPVGIVPVVPAGPKSFPNGPAPVVPKAPRKAVATGIAPHGCMAISKDEP